MQKEVSSLKSFGVFEEVTIDMVPKSSTIHNCRWLFTLKNYGLDAYEHGNDMAASGAEHEARLVVQGFTGPPIETYSPTPSA